MTRITLEISEDEALVLFEFLSRTDEAMAPLLEDQAEQRVLWSLAAALERQLPAAVAGDYESRLATARERVRDRPEDRR